MGGIKSEACLGPSPASMMEHFFQEWLMAKTILFKPSHDNALLD